MKFRFVEEGKKEEVREITKNGKFITSRTDAGIHYELNPDNDGYALIGIGCKDYDMDINKQEVVSSQYLNASDLREAADLFNFLADELDKVK